MDNINITKKVYKTLIYGIYLLYGIIFLGLWSSAPDYLEDLNYYLKVFVGIVLTYIFNPFYKQEFHSIHGNIAFSAGLLILTSTSLTAFQKRIQNTFVRVKDEILIL